MALAMAACGRAVALLLLAAGASAAQGRDAPTEPLLAALIRLQAALDDVPSCEFKTKDLWTDIEKRQQRLEKLQEGIFQKMNDIARLELEYPSATGSVSFRLQQTRVFWLRLFIQKEKKHQNKKRAILVNVSSDSNNDAQLRLS